jgi:hypothetical protein
VSTNFWFEDVIDAFLTACATGKNWRQACAAAQNDTTKPRRVITQKGLKAKGIPFSRQHLHRKIDAGAFPAPFQLPDGFDTA